MPDTPADDHRSRPLLLRVARPRLRGSCSAHGVLDTIEGALCEYALVVLAASVEYCAPSWTSDLVLGGLDPEHINVMASRWIECDLEPAVFAARLQVLASAIRGLQTHGELLPCRP